MANNDNLHQAKNAKNDEFYTQFNDIQREINAYIEYNPDVFRGKTVLCPCDDPEWSNFTKFFVLNFEYFGLKKLISTSYAIESKRYKSEWQPTLFETSHPQYDEQKSKVRGKIFVLDHDTKGNGRIDLDDLEWRYLEGDGDFRSAEVSALRDEADVIVTNPPFSLFREFLAWIREGDVESKSVSLSHIDEDTVSQATVLHTRSGKSKPRQEVVEDSPYPLKRGTPFNDLIDLKNFNDINAPSPSHKLFLIIGNMNAITYKEVFPLIKENKIWLGATANASDMVFGVPEGAEVSEKDRAKAARLGYVGDYTRLGNSCWFTNMEHGRRHRPMMLMTMKDNLRFNKKMRGKTAYDRYDNYDAIEVPYTELIPDDYEGVMGVPISFMDKYCPEQFEIVGWTRHNDLHMDGGYWKGGKPDATVNGKEVYRRILIRKRL